MKSILFALSLITLTGCSSVSSKANKERHQLELAIHKVKTDLEGVRHDVSTQQMEIGIIDAKVSSQNDTIDGLKSQNQASQKLTVDGLEYKITLLEKRISQLVESQSAVLSDLKKIETHANTSSEALAQQKRRLNEVEKKLQIISQAISEITTLKSDIESFNNTNLDQQEYIIKAGDSLEKIAKKHDTSISMLKKVNGLSSDIIRPGQKISVPS